MQNLDPTGVYTNDEVKEALSGASGVRDWDFRYERLDSQNNFIESLDSIQKCTIDNNALADIKRTAKFDILDTGTINYLQDRIKPYVRLNMPSGNDYGSYIADLQPSQWLQFDGTNVGVTDPTTMTTRTTNNDLTISSQATAMALSDSVDAVSVGLQGTGATVRKEAWFYVDINDSKPLKIQYNGSGILVNMFYRQGDGTLTDATYSTGIVSEATPKLGRYYVQIKATDTTSSTVNYTLVTLARPVLITDTVRSSRYIASSGSAYGSSLVNNGGSSLKSMSNDYISFGPSYSGYYEKIGPSFTGEFTVNMWAYVPSSWATVDDSNEVKLRFSSGDALYVTLYNDPTTGLVEVYTNDSYTYVESTFIPVSKIIGLHNFTFVMTPLVDGQTYVMSFYIDGVLFAEDENVYSDKFKTAFASSSQYIHPTMFSGYEWAIDELTIFHNRSLDAETISGIYAAGVAAKPPRRGYVEWPQGVFLLSSPTRTMKEGNEVVREVEAYDQLLALKEDSFDTRFSLPAGTNYINGVKSVLQSTKPIVDYSTINSWILTSKVTLSNGVYSFSQSSADAPPNQSILSSTDAIVYTGFALSAKIDVGTMGRVYVAVGIADGKNSTVGMFRDSSTNVVYTFSPSSNGYAYPRATYDAVAHKFWRLRENTGTLYWEVSPDGGTWSILFQETHSFQPALGLTVDIEGVINGSGTQTFTVSNLKLSGSPTVPAKVTNSTSVMLTAMEWDPGTTKLSVINDLLSAINYDSATYDENGLFIAQPYIVPTNRGSEFNYMTDANSVIAGDIDQTVDLFKIPNKWTLVVSEPDRPALVGTYTNSDPASPTSTVARGRTIVDFRTEQNAPDQVTLDAKAARLAFEASQVYEKIEFGTGLMPIHSNFDTYTLGIDGLAVKNKYSETAWSMDLDPGSIMKHTVRRIVNV